MLYDTTYYNKNKGAGLVFLVEHGRRAQSGEGRLHRAWRPGASAMDGYAGLSGASKSSRPGAESLAQLWHDIDGGCTI